MSFKNLLLALPLIFFLLFLSVNASFAQQGSVYFSVGDNMSWYKSSTIHVEQTELGNSYDLWKVKGNDKTNSSISALELNYRLGFYFNEVQDLGLEVNFDPVNYTVADGQKITVLGTVNNMLNVKTYADFSRKNGSYYYFDGLNVFLVNLVKRWRIYRSNSSKISVDFLGKGGIGPALPHFHSRLPVNPVDDPQLQWGGWNYGFEGALRVTLYRYAYLEFAGKYDYAMMEGMQIYQGSANQNLATYEVIASLGVTLPTTRFNPLFRKEHRIITMLPWYQHIDELGAGDVEQKNNKAGSGGAAADSMAIPEFDDILHKGERPLSLDSLAAMDSVGKIDTAKAAADTTKPAKDTTAVPEKHNRKWRKKHKHDADSTAAPATDSVHAAPPVQDTSATPAPSPTPPPTDSTQAPKLTDPSTGQLNEEDKDPLKDGIEGVEPISDLTRVTALKGLDLPARGEAPRAG